ncbi:MAG: glycosyltransferase family 4 protein [Pirellulaceae bacterium]|jgi:glycosyltransferase involved in cell wall biosynthesis|nr:glycosyltransferase family 4 protein [Pirellulaceae bacterium]
MRIAHIITRMIIGGAQENTLLCCRDLVQLFGDETLLVTGPALGPEGDLLTGAGDLEFPVELVPSLVRPIHPWHDLRASRALRRILRSFRPDVVHTHSAKAGWLGRWAAWSLRVPVVVHTVHGAPFHPYQPAPAREFFRRCEQFAARRCHHLVSVADAMTDQLVAAGVAPRDKFTTVYSGMEVEPFLDAARERAATRAALGLDAAHVVVGKIARLFHLKGHGDVIAAARAVIAQCPDVRFVFVGDGVLRPALETQLAAAGLTPYVRFTGLVPPTRIPALLGAMDVLVHASLREGLARALPQALIAGKPVVSYDVDGAREVVRDGETGYLIPPRNVQALAAALIRLAQQPDLRARFGATGRARCTDQFRHETMTRQLHALYERLPSAGGLG